jgi:hypothetical protein
MIVWGGLRGMNLNDGGGYDPAVNAWRALGLTGAPIGRDYYTAVWTGREMIIWGGIVNGPQFFNEASCYTPGEILILYQRP